MAKAQDGVSTYLRQQIVTGEDNNRISLRMGQLEYAMNVHDNISVNSADGIVLQEVKIIVLKEIKPDYCLP